MDHVRACAAFGRGDKLVVINKSTTGRDSEADLVISDAIGAVFDQITVRPL